MRSCILIAERDRLLAESLLASFGRSGIAAHWENELSQICSAMRSLLPNVLVLGNIGSVPDLSYLCQVLRSDSMTAAIPVLFVLADQWLDELSMGTVDYVSRTGSPEAIVEHTKRLMGTNAIVFGTAIAQFVLIQGWWLEVESLQRSIGGGCCGSDAMEARRTFIGAA